MAIFNSFLYVYQRVQSQKVFGAIGLIHLRSHQPGTPGNPWEPLTPDPREPKNPSQLSGKRWLLAAAVRVSGTGPGPKVMEVTGTSNNYGL